MRKSVGTSAEDLTPKSEAVISGVVALVGSPNCGKTTLFNWLTGSKFKTVNYPGATVDYSVGTSHDRYGQRVSVMDTPGTYSLEPKSPDEQVTLKALFAHPTFGAARLVISVADATHLARHLLVTRQLIECGFKVVLAVTMQDLLSENGQVLDTKTLSRELGIPVVLIDGRLGGGVQDLINVVREQLQLKTNGRVETATPSEKLTVKSWTPEQVESLIIHNGVLLRQSLKESVKFQTEHKTSVTRSKTSAERTRTIDHWLLHPVWGLVFFFSIMTALFTAIFWVAQPVMSLVDATFSLIAEKLLTLDPQNLGLQFISNGVIAAASSVLVFVPQIFILFIGIILLEDSGYLARSATLIDRPLAKIGLGGRSFVPLLSGYACAVPAMMAARTINSRKERWLTLFIIPLMSCSARLPVYALLLSFLFLHQAAWKAGLMLALIYIVSMLVGALAAAIASHVIKFKDSSFFMLELPTYRRPQARHVLLQAFSRTKNYVKRAGPTIFTFALILWLASTFPNFREQDKSLRLQSSYAAQVGRIFQPVFTPMGGDWRTGVGLISAFTAREVFVSSLAIVFQVADQDDATMQSHLLEKMHDATAPNGKPLFSIASVLGLIVFFMIALQCLSTVTVAAKESGGWKFALMQLAVFNVVAYVLAVGLVQGLRALGIT